MHAVLYGAQNLVTATFVRTIFFAQMEVPANVHAFFTQKFHRELRYYIEKI